MNSPQPFKHVVIVGVGLLGSSLGLALRKLRLADHVTGVGRAGSGSLQVAIARGAIQSATTELAAAVRGTLHTGPADLVVLCTPVRQFPEAFAAMAPALAVGTLVTDVGSTKAQVLRWARELLPAPPLAHFVGSHPMAGSEKSGPEAAREDLYRDAVCLLCPPTGAHPAAVERIRFLWQSLKMRLIELPGERGGEEHDRWVATVSHLPHALAFSLVNAVAREPAMLEAVAGGFIDTTRVASSDVTMWSDIFLTNREAVLAAMRDFEMDWTALKDAIARGDEAAIRVILQNARQTRDALIEKRRALGLSNQAAGREA